MFLTATWQHFVSTTGGFRQMSVEVLGLAFSTSKHGGLNCLFNDAQRIEWWPADIVCLELKKQRTNVLFQCLSHAFL